MIRIHFFKKQKLKKIYFKINNTWKAIQITKVKKYLFLCIFRVTSKKLVIFSLAVTAYIYRTKGEQTLANPFDYTILQNNTFIRFCTVSGFSCVFQYAEFRYAELYLYHVSLSHKVKIKIQGESHRKPRSK